MTAPKSLDGSPSPFVLNCFNSVRNVPSNLAADVACGYGRHAIFLASLGYNVACIDRDEDAILAISGSTRNANGEVSGHTFAVRADLSLGVPLKTACLGLLIAVHYPMLDLVPNFEALLMPGGYIILETFGGQGGNWRQLPKAGYIRTQLQFGFELIRYAERRVRPAGANAVSVRGFARRQ